MNAQDFGDGRGTQGRLAEESASGAKASAFAPPDWARDAGRWGWILIGIGVVLLAVFAVAAAARLLVLAALFAVLLGGTFLPVVDWLARHHFKRWMAALLMVALSILLAILISLVILYGIVKQVPTIQQNLSSAWDSIQKQLSSGLSQDQMDQIKSGVQSAAKKATSGAAGSIGTLISDVGSLIFGIFISINIGVWVMIRGREIGDWASRHVAPVPQPVAYRIFANSARFFRGYIYGSTIVGLFNGVVVGVGALIIGVPMAATIGIVAWLLNYIPYFGAIISGAFTVLIAWGAGGASMAVPMLIVVIVANGFLQTLISQFALGSALDLHPLVVLFATTAGGILFGAVGGVFAAPFVKITIDAYTRIKEAGVFEPVAAPGRAPAAPDTNGPPGFVDAAPPGLVDLPAET